MEGGFLVEHFKMSCYCKESLKNSTLKLPVMTLGEIGEQD